MSCSYTLLNFVAFYFGFVLNEVTYDEARDEGLQKIRYSPAPGNKTEKSFVFMLNLIALQSGFSMLSFIVQCELINSLFCLYQQLMVQISALVQAEDKLILLTTQMMHLKIVL